LALSGDLATMGLEDIFQWLAVGKKTGVLELRGSLHTKRVAFHEGRITSIWSSDPREYLGQYLLAFNRITEEQLRDALATQEDEQQLLGRILINRQLVTEAEIRRIVQLKVEESIYDTFLWNVGSFEFHDGAASHQKSMLLSLDVTGIVLEGARRMDDWKRIRKVIKGGDAVLAPISEAIAERLPLATDDADILARLDGHKRVDQLVLDMRMPEYKINKLLFDLHEKGLVRILNSGGNLGENPSLQLQRARALVEKQKLQEAQEELRRILKDQPRHLDASKMMAVVQDLLEDKKLDQDLIPELAVSLDELMTTNLGPNEAFLASRVNGLWAIRDILTIAPFEQDECLAIFSKLIKRGILKTTKPAQGGHQPDALR
jgi:CheY-like chemotaxis protein